MSRVGYLGRSAQICRDAEVGMLGSMGEAVHFGDIGQQLDLAELGDCGLIGFGELGGITLWGVEREGEVFVPGGRGLEGTAAVVAGEVLEDALHLGHLLGVHVCLLLQRRQQSYCTLHNVADARRLSLLVLLPKLPADELHQHVQTHPMLLLLALHLEQSGQGSGEGGEGVPLVLLLQAGRTGQLVASPHAFQLLAERCYHFPAV